MYNRNISKSCQGVLWISSMSFMEIVGLRVLLRGSDICMPLGAGLVMRKSHSITLVQFSRSRVRLGAKELYGVVVETLWTSTV